jgi:predicted enzyme related to lactoylglutathione lyase
MGKKNPIQHVEWRTKDAKRLQKFYGSIFNWKFDDSMPGYTMIDHGSKDGGGGFFQLSPEMQIPIGITNYATVENLDETEAKIKAAGGNIMMSKQAVEGYGSFTVFTDPDGNSFAAWQAAPKPKKKDKKDKKKKKKK